MEALAALDTSRLSLADDAYEQDDCYVILNLKLDVTNVDYV